MNTLFSRVLATLALIACSTSLADEYNGRFARHAATPTDRVIIKWRTTAEASIGATDVRDRVTRLAAATGLRLQAVRDVAPRLQLVRLDQPLAAAALEQTLAELNSNAAVEYAVADQRRWPHAVPNDTLFSGQWFLQTAQPAAIRATTAWDTTTGSTGTVVAVLDTGVRFEHPDLARAEQAGKLLPGYDFVSGNAGSFAIANDGNGRDPDPSDPGDWISSSDIQDPEFADCEPADSSWHGTRVSGIIGALSNNGVGVSGEAWNTWILPLRVLGKCGGFDSDILSAMRWAAGLSVAGVPANPYPAKVINLSLGSNSTCPATYMSVIDELANLGVLVVASVGNEGVAVSAPANCPGVLAVGAIRHVGTKVGFSNLGPLVGISAPGGNCVTVMPGDPCQFSIDTTINTGTTGPASSTYTDQFNFNVGTSFSAPIVAGAAALMHAVNARLGPALLISRLKSAAVPFPVPAIPPAGGTCRIPAGDIQVQECVCTTSTCGAGMLNASAAVAQALRPIVNITLPAVVTPGLNISLDGSVSAAACNRTVSTYAWAIAPGSGSTPITGANEAVATVQAPMNGSFTLRLTITDSAGAQDFADVTVTPSAASTTAIAPLSGNACPTPITVPQTPPPPSGGGGGGGGGGGTLGLELLLFALLLIGARIRAARIRHPLKT